jgi:methylglyoxal synthase
VQGSGRCELRVYNIPVACNRATADFIVSSPLMKEEYRRLTMGIEDQLVGWVSPVHTM